MFGKILSDRRTYVMIATRIVYKLLVSFKIVEPSEEIRLALETVIDGLILWFMRSAIKKAQTGPSSAGPL